MAARELDGASWADVGTALGMTRQSAHERFRTGPDGFHSRWYKLRSTKYRSCPTPRSPPVGTARWSVRSEQMDFCLRCQMNGAASAGVDVLGMDESSAGGGSRRRGVDRSGGQLARVGSCSGSFSGGVAPAG